MINEETVYKIRLKGLSANPDSIWHNDSWVHGFNVIPKLGGSGKTFTSKKLVNKMFNAIKGCGVYGSEFVCEIVTFKLDEIEVSESDI